MKKGIKLQGIGILTLCIFAQSLATFISEHKEAVPIIKQFIHAAYIGDKEKVTTLHAQDSLLIHYKDGLEEWPALHSATKARRKSIITLLLNLKADVHIKTGCGNTPLHLAAQEKDNEEIINLLIEKQANVNCVNKGGDTPLHLAAKHGNQEAVGLLLSHGACLSLCNESGKTADEIMIEKENPKVISKRPRKRKRPSAIPSMTVPQKEIFAKVGSAIQSLSKAAFATLPKTSAQPDFVSTISDLTPLHKAAFHGENIVVSMLLMADAHKDAVALYGMTPLHMASNKGHEVVVNLLLSAGAKTDVLDTYDFTPLHRAARKGYWAIVVMLLVAGAKVDPVDNLCGWTPLHWAASGGHEQAITMLLIAGANKRAADGRGLTPLHVATMSDHKAAVVLLID